MICAPFLPLLYIYANFNCLNPDEYYKAGGIIREECEARIRTTGFSVTALIFSLTIGLITFIIMFHKKTVSTFSPQISKIEKRLMFQALTTLIFYGIHRITEFFGN